MIPSYVLKDGKCFVKGAASPTIAVVASKKRHGQYQEDGPTMVKSVLHVLASEPLKEGHVVAKPEDVVAACAAGNPEVKPSPVPVIEGWSAPKAAPAKSAKE